MVRQPFVSIGMPVYNGANFLRQALDCLVAQDHTNFELIISDNASGDSTGEICREYLAHDPRLRYVLQSENRGAPWNFEFVARQACGQYFMWAAHDDLWEPTFIRKCVALLEAHPTAVLCCTEDKVIDETGTAIPEWSGYKNIATLGMTPVQRIHELICRMGWFTLYGLIRRDALLKISLGLKVLGADVIMLLELLLLGDFVKVEEHLFCTRVVGKQRTLDEYREIFQLESVPTTHYTNSAAELLRTVYRSSLSSPEKTEIFADFIHTLTLQNPHWRRLIMQELAPSAALDDAEFAFLVGVALNGCVPFDEVKHNPISQAIYAARDFVPELLPLARKLLEIPDPVDNSPANRKHIQGVHLFEEGRLEEALASLEESLGYKESSEAWGDWAAIQYSLKSFPEAEGGFRRALCLDARNRQAAVNLGVLLAELGKRAESVFFLQYGLGGAEHTQRTAARRILDECRKKLALPLLAVSVR